MSRVLLDENLPVGLRDLIDGHEVSHVTWIGLEGIGNGDLIVAAEAAGFEVLITADKNLRYQQNLSERRLAIVVLNTNRWVDLRSSAEFVKAAIDQASPGTFLDVAVRQRGFER